MSKTKKFDIKWLLPNKAKPTSKNWKRYQESLLVKKVCSGCDRVGLACEFVRNVETGRLKSICADCYKAGIEPFRARGKRTRFSKLNQPVLRAKEQQLVKQGSMIPSPENQVNLTANSGELGGTFSNLGLSDNEAKLAGELMGKRRKKK